MIKMKNLTLGYKKEKILDKLNLKIKEGEFVGIIGPSGAGKSTLLMSVVGGIKVFNGEFEVLDYDMDNIKKKDLVKLREQIGIIFQGYNLVDRLSVLDNVISGMLKDIPMARAIIKYYRENDDIKIHKGFVIPDEIVVGSDSRVLMAATIISLNSEKKVKLVYESLKTNNYPEFFSDLEKLQFI